MNLSKHLSLAEVVRSSTAKRLGISNQPTAQHLENLTLLAEKIFEPVREHFDVPIYISSGYRSAELNKAIKGSSTTSLHLSGKAIDIDMDGIDSKVSNKMIFDFIKNNLNFTELIYEFGDDNNPDWVHVGYDEKKLTKETLKSVRVNGKVVYKKY